MKDDNKQTETHPEPSLPDLQVQDLSQSAEQDDSVKGGGGQVTFIIDGAHR